MITAIQHNTMVSKQAKRVRRTISYRVFSCLLAFTFIVSSIVPPNRAQAQAIPNLPLPGIMVPLSSAFVPTIIKGINIQPDNPLQFDFIVDAGDAGLEGDEFNDEAIKLIKYFLASLTLKEEEMWVNLSPYEKDRIIPDEFGKTEMGRDLLIQDYLLKQLTASLIYPENDLGKKFWDRVYIKAQEQFGTTEIPMNTFNKVWIVPESAQVFEHDKGAFVVSSHLKVMLEEDYVALEQYDQELEDGKMKMDSRSLMLDTESSDIDTRYSILDASIQDQETLSKKIVSGVSSEIIRDLLIPEIEKEVNEGKTFANLRQIFNSMILATWYKQNLKESLLSQVYVNQNKLKGVELDDPTVHQKIYDQYVKAFKKGVFNYIKEDIVAIESQQDSTATSRLSFEAKHEQNLAKEEAPARDDPNTQEIIPRKYFSGGFASSPLPQVVAKGTESTVSSRINPNNWVKDGKGSVLRVNLKAYERDGENKLQKTVSSPITRSKGSGDRENLVIVKNRFREKIYRLFGGNNSLVDIGLWQRTFDDQINFSTVSFHDQIAQESIFAQFDHLEKLDLIRPVFWIEEVREEVIRNRLSLQAKKQDDRPVAVIIYPQQDEKGVFIQEDYILRLMNDGYRVIYYEVPDRKEFVSALKEHEQQSVSLIIVAGLGDQGAIRLSQNNRLTNADERFFIRKVAK